MSYARRHSTNVCPGNRVRYTATQRTTAQLLSEHPILLAEIVDQILLVAVQPASSGEDQKLQCIGHPVRLPDRGVGHWIRRLDRRPTIGTLRG